jgi:hypothetical protein
MKVKKYNGGGQKTSRFLPPSEQVTDLNMEDMEAPEDDEYDEDDEDKETRTLMKSSTDLLAKTKSDHPTINLDEEVLSEEENLALENELDDLMLENENDNQDDESTYGGRKTRRRKTSKRKTSKRKTRRRKTRRRKTNRRKRSLRY